MRYQGQFYRHCDYGIWHGMLYESQRNCWGKVAKESWIACFKNERYHGFGMLHMLKWKLPLSNILKYFIIVPASIRHLVIVHLFSILVAVRVSKIKKTAAWHSPNSGLNIEGTSDGFFEVFVHHPHTNITTFMVDYPRNIFATSFDMLLRFHW